jgi:hypothetical protein
MTEKFSARTIATIIKGHYTRSEINQKKSLVASFVAQLADRDPDFDAALFIRSSLLEAEHIDIKEIL